MTLPSRSILAVAVALASHGALAADTYLNVFFGEDQLKGVEVKFDGTFIGETDERGSLSVETAEGEHIIDLVRAGEVITSFSYETQKNQDAEISVTFSAESDKPVVNVAKFDSSDASAKGFLGGVIRNMSGEPVEGALVSVSGSDKEALTNAQGAYELELPRGNYALEVAHGDYASSRVGDVHVVANLGVSVSLKLSKKQDLLITAAPTIQVPAEEMIVRGSYKRIDSAVSVERFSTNVLDAIDLEQLARFGDSDAAGALKRIAGVTIKGGQYANVRGLDGRYISSSLNGILMPSTDPIRRDVQLDLFPSNVLDGIDIQKSYSADKLGTTTGGHIGIKTKGLPDERVFNFSVSVGGNTNATGKDITAYQGSGADWTGRDFDDRHLSEQVLQGTNGARSLTICDDPTKGCIDTAVALAYAVTFEDRYSVNKEKGNPDVNISAAYGDLYSLDFGEFGFYGSLNYGSKTSARSDGQFDDPQQRIGTYDQSRKNIALNGYLVAGLKSRDRDELLSKTILLRNTDDTTRLESFVDVEDSNIEEVTLEWVERQFVSQQFSGLHAFDTDAFNQEVSWTAAYTNTFRYEPDRRNYRFSNGNLVYTNLERRWSELDEDSVDISANYRAEFDIASFLSSEISVGALSSKRSRVFDLYRFGLIGGDNVSEFNAQGNSSTTDELLAYEFFANDQLRIATRTADSDSYTADENISAYYVSTESNFNDLVTIALGVRFEEFDQELRYPNENSIDSKLVSDEMLPSFSVNYQISDDIQLRASWSETVSYPGLIERSDSLVFDPETNRPISGNPELQVSSIENLDLRLEYYLSNTDSISFAVFKKEIDNPIEKSMADGSGSNVEAISFKNQDAATLTGVELDFNLSVLDMENYYGFVGGNVSYIESEVDFSNDSLRIEGENQNGRQLQGQAPWLANLQLGLDHIPSEQKFTLLINYTDDRIDRISSLIQNGPEIRKARTTLDFNYEKLVGDSLTISLKAKNLLDEKVIRDRDGQEIESYGVGSSFSLGANYTF